MESKMCPRCGQHKAIDEFGFKNPARGWRQSWCRACERIYKADWYAQRRQQHIAYVRVGRARIKRANRARVLAYLSEHPCVDCGEGNLVVLDFDHVRDKRGNVTAMVMGGFCWKTIEVEIAKCEVRCVNCHRIKTARERGFYDRKSNGQLFEQACHYRVLPDNYARAVSSADRAPVF